jgi:hypothetical protein
MEEKTCFRCGDVLLYCKCIEEFFGERSELSAMGIDPDQLDPWEVQVPTYLELQRAGRPPEEREYWMGRYRRVRGMARGG